MGPQGLDHLCNMFISVNVLRIVTGFTVPTVILLLGLQKANVRCIKPYRAKSLSPSRGVENSSVFINGCKSK